MPHVRSAKLKLVSQNTWKTCQSNKQESAQREPFSAEGGHGSHHSTSCSTKGCPMSNAAQTAHPGCTSTRSEGNAVAASIVKPCHTRTGMSMLLGHRQRYLAHHYVHMCHHMSFLKEDDVFDQDIWRWSMSCDVMLCMCGSPCWQLPQDSLCMTQQCFAFELHSTWAYMTRLQWCFPFTIFARVSLPSLITPLCTFICH